MDSGQELEVLNWDLRRLDTEFMVEFSLRSVLHTCHSFCQFSTAFTRYSKRVRAACVGPHIREGDLLCCALLEKQFVLGIEEEDGECAV